MLKYFSDVMTMKPLSTVPCEKLSNTPKFSSPTPTSEDVQIKQMLLSKLNKYRTKQHWHKYILIEIGYILFGLDELYFLVDIIISEWSWERRYQLSGELYSNKSVQLITLIECLCNKMQHSWGMMHPAGLDCFEMIISIWKVGLGHDHDHEYFAS